MSQGLERPAIAGGSPARREPATRSNRYGGEELRQLREALEQGTLFYAQGRKVREMERVAAGLIGARHAVAASSGTAAIHAAVMAAGVSPGDEVIVSPITDMGSIVPILFQGGVPVFADVDPRTGNMDPSSVRQRLSERTRVVLAVHLAGNPCDLDALRSLCDASGATLIEDCAQAWGAEYRGRPVGTRGDIGCYSFNEFKHISCGDGGLAITDDPALARRLRLATDKGYDREADSAAMRNATFLASNYRMTELQGAVALAQLGKLDSIVARRRAFWSGLREGLEDLPGIFLPEVTPGGAHSAWFFLLAVEPATLGADASQLAEGLRAEGVPASAHYIGTPIYLYPLFTSHSAFAHAPHPFACRPYSEGLCPRAEELLKTCVVLPVHEEATQREKEETVHAVRRLAKWFHASR